MEQEQDTKLLTSQEKQSKYDQIKKYLKKFYSSYNDDEFGLGQQAKYTVVSAAINNEFPHFNFVGFYTVETRALKVGAKGVKEGGCLSPDADPLECTDGEEVDSEPKTGSGKFNF